MISGSFSRREEVLNAITHGLGALLSVAALVLLIVFSALYGTAWHVTSFAIFGSALVILYCASTLYHSFRQPRVKKLFRKFDHMSIFLLIAGTYTPFCFTLLHGWLGWTLFGIVWFCATAGIALKAFYTGKGEILSTILYVIMGWIICFFIKPLYSAISPEGLALLVSGGTLYTAGVYFLVKDKTKYFHSIWHLFVLGGSTLHFFAVLTLL